MNFGLFGNRTPTVDHIYASESGIITPRGGSMVLPRSFRNDYLSRQEPFSVKGLRPADLAVFVTCRDELFSFYVTDVAWNGTGSLVNSDFVHANPYEFVTPYLRNTVTGLQSDELLQFGEENVLPILQYLGIRDPSVSDTTIY